jgi:D-3-phosphoglycerate dehydrogenase / 2-oxoglutarate reductase
MSTRRVILLDPAGGVEPVAQALGEFSDVRVERADAAPSGPDIVALLVPPEVPVGSLECEALPDLRIVATTSTGYDHLDLEALAAAGVWGTHCAGYCDHEVADHAIALALDLLRGITILDRSVRAGGWDQTPSPPRRIAGSVLGVLGLGRIGREVARRARALEMRVLAHDPFLSDTDIPGVELAALDELMAAADVVTLHALLTPESREMIGERELAMMRPGSYLVNCSRAALVDHDALGAALISGHLGGCGLDVLPYEPPGDDEPALRWPRTIVTPHSAWFSPDSEHAPYRLAGEAVAAVLEGREPRHVVARPASKARRQAAGPTGAYPRRDR